MAENELELNSDDTSKNNLEEFSYPSDDCMEKILKEQVQLLFKKLNINLQHPKIYDIAKIYEEFSNTLVYDEQISKNRVNCARVQKINAIKQLLRTYNSDNYYKEQLGIFKQIKNREELIKRAAVPAEKFSLKYYVKNLINQSSLKCEEEIERLKTNNYQKSFFESIYNTLIYKRGVCFDFSNTFLYILNEMQIKSYRVNIGTSENNVNHTFVAVSFLEDEKNKLFLMDVTNALKSGEKNPPKVLYQFGMGKEKLDRYGYYEFISFDDMENGIGALKTNSAVIDENLVQGLDKKLIQKWADKLNAENNLNNQELSL